MAKALLILSGVMSRLKPRPTKYKISRAARDLFQRRRVRAGHERALGYKGAAKPQFNSPCQCRMLL